MKEIINRFFGREAPSKDAAKQRLKFLLIHDQVDLTPGQLDQMKAEILEVVARYVEVEGDDTQFKLERCDGQVALVSSVPVRRVVQRKERTAG
ncbi:MAG: cell division topological specificity factor MinE [Myxococcota bacterium]|nr:cell division topological specificity factor MinE [Myxococcota bacterium]